MIISHSRKFIFVHLHKTAGTSIKEAIRPFLAEGDLFIGVGPKGPITQGLNESCKSLKKHSSAAEIAKWLGSELWNSYFKFSFVRHPYDRLVSLYEFFHRVKRNNTDRPGFFKRILNALQFSSPKFDHDRPPWNWPGMQALLTTDNFSDFIRSEYLDHDQGAAPQSDSLTDDSGSIMLDFVGKMESLDQDWHQVCDQLGLEIPLAHKNQSQRRHEDLRHYWTEQDLEFAAKKYESDFELLNYSPDLFVR